MSFDRLSLLLILFHFSFFLHILRITHTYRHRITCRRIKESMPCYQQSNDILGGGRGRFLYHEEEESARYTGTEHTHPHTYHFLLRMMVMRQKSSPCLLPGSFLSLQLNYYTGSFTLTILSPALLSTAPQAGMPRIAYTEFDQIRDWVEIYLTECGKTDVPVVMRSNPALYSRCCLWV